MATKKSDLYVFTKAKELAEDMFDTMISLDGVGLAGHANAARIR